jgi:hypothetical protein
MSRTTTSALRSTLLAAATASALPLLPGPGLRPSWAVPADAVVVEIGSGSYRFAYTTQG